MDDVGGDEDACGFGIAVEASQKKGDGGLDMSHALGSNLLWYQTSTMVGPGPGATKHS